MNHPEVAHGLPVGHACVAYEAPVGRPWMPMGHYSGSFMGHPWVARVWRIDHPFLRVATSSAVHGSPVGYPRVAVEGTHGLCLGYLWVIRGSPRISC